MENESSIRFKTLDGMRGIAAFAVMIAHFTQRTEMRIFTNSGFAVDLFFCLSGFVIAMSYYDRIGKVMSVGEFLVRRAIRLYPMFLIGFSFGIISLCFKVVCNQTTLGFNGVVQAILLNVLYIPYLSDFEIYNGFVLTRSSIFPVNDPGWSLFFELFVNLVFGGLIYWASCRRVAIVTFVFLILFVAYCYVFHQGEPGWGKENFWGGFPRVLWGFCSGILIYLVLLRFKKLSLKIFHPVLIYVLLIAALLLPAAGWIWLSCSIVFVPAFVLAGAVCSDVYSRFIALCDYLGWLSYPVYCMHYPIMVFFTILNQNKVIPVYALALYLPLTVALSHVLAKMVEEPIRNSLRRKFL